MNSPSTFALRFGVFELDLRTGELKKAGAPVRLPPQPSRILALLASRPGQLVTREEIQKEVWGNDTFVDFEKGLNFAIRRIRASLGDDAETPRYIETLPKRGYRFIAPVEATPQGESIASLSPPDRKVIPVPTPKPPHRRSRGLFLVSLTLLLVAGSLLGWQFLNRAVARPIRSIAVLPLENLSGDPDQEYFVDGLTDELITELAKIRELRVPSRTSAMTYKKTRKPLPQIAHELNVDAILEGTVSRSGNQIKIRAQLIHADPEEHIWADTYQSDIGDVLSVQSRMAKTIAQQVRINLTAEEQAQLSHKQSTNADALEQYWRGRFLWSKREKGPLTESIRHFEKAIDMDPRYARAYAALADSYAVASDYDLFPPEDAFAKAKKAAETALELDPMLGEAHATLGSIKAEHDWDWPGAEQQFQQAIKLTPNYATAHQWYSEYLLRCGHLDQALREIDRAYELDPLSPIINAEKRADLYWARRYDEAINQLSVLIEQEDGLDYAHSWLGFSYVQKKMWPEAIAQFKKAVDISPDSLSFKANLGFALGLAGEKSKAEEIVQELEMQANQTYVSPYAISLVYTGLADKSRALDWLEEAYARRDPGLDLIKIEPALDSLRSEPRFKELQNRMGLPP